MEIAKNSSIHLWTLSQDQPEERLEVFSTWLDTAERARAEAYRFEKDRKRFIARHGLVRLVLSRYLGKEPGELRFAEGVNGKPYLLNDESQSFNLSHSGALAVLAVGRDRRVGVDVEVFRPETPCDSLVENFFSEREQREWQGLAVEKRLGAFFTAWTRKEAVLKALGVGLGLEPRQVEVSLAEDEADWLFSKEGDEAEPQRWTLLQVRPTPDSTAALVVEGKGGSFRFLNVDDL